MTTRGKSILLLILFAALAPLSGRSEALVLPTPTSPVYDIAGTLWFTNIVDGESSLVFQLPLEQDARGRLSVDREDGAVLFNDTWLPARMRAHGRISGGGGGTTRITLSVHLSDRGSIAGVERAYRASISYVFTVQDEALVGTARGSFNVSNGGNGRIRNFDMVVPLVPGTSGAWNTVMNVETIGRRISGTGWVVFPHERAFPTTISGTESSSGVSSVSIRTDSPNRGSKLRARFIAGEGSVVDLISLRGTMLGQRVRE